MSRAIVASAIPFVVCATRLLGQVAGDGPEGGVGDAAEVAAPPRWITERDAWRALPMQERHAARLQMERATVASFRAGVRAPWRAKQGKWLYVISDLDRKTVDATYAKFESW